MNEWSGVVEDALYLFLFGYLTGLPLSNCDSVSIVADIVEKILNPRRTNIFGMEGVQNKMSTSIMYEPMYL